MLYRGWNTQENDLFPLSSEQQAFLAPAKFLSDGSHILGLDHPKNVRLPISEKRDGK